MDSQPACGEGERPAGSQRDNRGMLRLDPAHPPLWRSATCLQFGVDDRARLDDPEPWEELLLADLARGLAPAAVDAFLRTHDVPPDRAEAFFADLQPVLRDDPSPPPIVVQSADDLSARDLLAVTDALERFGVSVEVQAWGARPAPIMDRGATVIVAAAYRVEPRRAAALVREDLRHLPLVFDAAGASVGPLVVPGRTGCLACTDAYARDLDPAWPLVSSQLLGRRAPVVGPDLAAEAARVAVQLISAPDPTPSPSSVRLRVDSPHRRWRQHPPHAECGCRSLGEIEKEPARLVPIPVPSSTREYARPA